MTSRFVVLALDALDTERIAQFWCDVLGWQVVERGDGVVSIASAGGASPSIDILPVPEHKTIKNRLHLDLRADGTSQDEEVERLLALGARRGNVGQAPDVSWAVLTDPEGNEFCVLRGTTQDAG